MMVDAALLAEQMNTKINKIADVKGNSMGAVLREAIHDYLLKNNNGEDGEDGEKNNTKISK